MVIGRRRQRARKHFILLSVVVVSRMCPVRSSLSNSDALAFAGIRSQYFCQPSPSCRHAQLGSSVVYTTCLSPARSHKAIHSVKIPDFSENSELLHEFSRRAIFMAPIQSSFRFICPRTKIYIEDYYIAIPVRTRTLYESTKGRAGRGQGKTARSNMACHVGKSTAVYHSTGVFCG